MNIVCFATAWGPKFGGINAFNRDFAVGLAQELGSTGRVFCAVVNPTDEDLADANKNLVIIVPISDKSHNETFDSSWVQEAQRRLRDTKSTAVIDWWIGHDLISGSAALNESALSGGRQA